MCEFHESTCNGFGDIWWTDNPIYFSSIDVFAACGSVVVDLCNWGHLNWHQVNLQRNLLRNFQPLRWIWLVLSQPSAARIPHEGSCTRNANGLSLFRIPTPQFYFLSVLEVHFFNTFIST